MRQSRHRREQAAIWPELAWVPPLSLRFRLWWVLIGRRRVLRLAQRRLQAALDADQR
jgi:hypothetical protein